MAIFFLERGTISVLINNETGLWWAYRSKNDNHQSKVVCVDQAELLSQLIDRAYQSSAEKMYAILLNYSIEKRPVDLRYLILNVTSNCNLRCEYCYAKEQKKQDHMSYEVMSSAIENFYAATEGAASRVIAFHGGEPLLHYGEILRVVDKFKCNRTHFLIQTNGTLLSNDLIQELRLRDIEVGITIDSIDEKKTSLRSNEDNYTQKVFYNLKKAAEMGVAQSVLSIIQEGNVSDLISMTRVFNSLGISVVKILISMGIRNVALNPYISAGRGSIANLGVTNEQMFNLFKDLSDMILSLYYKDNIIFIEKNLFHIVKKIVTGGNSYMCMSNPCGAGLSQFTVDPNADVYPCADLCGQKHFRLGNIGEDFFPMIPSCEGWREIRSYKLQNLTGCKKCTLIKTCPAGCSVRCYYSNDSVHSTDPLCGFYKLILPYLDDTGLAKKIYNIYVN